VSENALVVEAREKSGKGIARRLRAAGRIPGIFYGNKEEPRHISLDPRELQALLEKSDAGMNTLINLTIQGESGESIALVKEIQRDPVSSSYLHLDLIRVDVTNRIHVTVPIHISGIAIGVRMDDGIMDHSMRELDLECMPRAIPKEILADVTELGVGDSLHVRDLSIPEDVKLLNDVDLPVVSVVAPTVVEEPEVAEEGEEEEAAAEASDEAGADDSKAKDAPKDAPKEGSGD